MNSWCKFADRSTAADGYVVTRRKVSIDADGPVDVSFEPVVISVHVLPCAGDARRGGLRVPFEDWKERVVHVFEACGVAILGVGSLVALVGGVRRCPARSGARRTN
jgi:hypothetical protein